VDRTLPAKRKGFAPGALGKGEEAVQSLREAFLMGFFYGKLTLPKNQT